MKKLFFLSLLLASPLYAGQKYDYKDPQLNDEWNNNYKEHTYPNWVIAKGSSMTITYIKVSSINLNGVNLTSGGAGLSSTQTWTGGNTFTGTFTASTGTINSFMVVGTATNDNSPTGRMGEYFSATASNVSFPTSGQDGDLASIALTAGDWDVSACIYVSANGATVTRYNLGITSHSGNDATGEVAGDNYFYNLPPTTVTDVGSCVASVRVALSGAATYYLKFNANYTVATPKGYGRISARRLR